MFIDNFYYIKPEIEELEIVTSYEWCGGLISLPGDFKRFHLKSCTSSTLALVKVMLGTITENPQILGAPHNIQCF